MPSSDRLSAQVIFSNSDSRRFLSVADTKFRQAKHAKSSQDTVTAHGTCHGQSLSQALFNEAEQAYPSSSSPRLCNLAPTSFSAVQLLFETASWQQIKNSILTFRLSFAVTTPKQVPRYGWGTRKQFAPHPPRNKLIHFTGATTGIYCGLNEPR